MIEAMTIGNKQISNLSASGDATQISAILDVHQTVINIGLSPETNQDSELVAECIPGRFFASSICIFAFIYIVQVLT